MSVCLNHTDSSGLQRLNPDLNDDFMTQAFQYGINQVKSAQPEVFSELETQFGHVGGVDQAATLLLKTRAFMTGNNKLSFSAAAWEAINPDIKDPAPSGFKTALNNVGTLASAASFGFGVAQLASDKGKCLTVLLCIQTYAGDVKDGMELLEPALKLIPKFNEGLEAFEATAKTEAFGTILIDDSEAGFQAMQTVMGGMLSTGVELAKTGDLISMAQTASTEVLT